jgi:hypothetical protein
LLCLQQNLLIRRAFLYTPRDICDTFNDTHTAFGVQTQCRHGEGPWNDDQMRLERQKKPFYKQKDKSKAQKETAHRVTLSTSAIYVETKRKLKRALKRAPSYDEVMDEIERSGGWHTAELIWGIETKLADLAKLLDGLKRALKL